MKKVVLKLELPDDESKKKVMQKVSSLAGVDSISMDMKDKKLTVTGDIDPVNIVSKLRKLCRTEILTVGPAKEEKKKEEPKKDEQKKQEDQKKDQKDQKPEITCPYPPLYYNPYLNTPYVRTVEEEPSPGCVIS